MARGDTPSVLLAPCYWLHQLEDEQDKRLQDKTSLEVPRTEWARGDSREMVSHMIWLKIKAYLMLNCGAALCCWSAGPRMIVVYLERTLRV